MPRILLLLRALLGVFLLGTSFLPFESLFGKFRDGSALTSASNSGLRLLSVILLSALAAGLAPPGLFVTWSRLRQRFHKIPFLPLLWICSLGLFVFEIILSIFVFDCRPLLVDGVVQLFQGEIFADGGFTAPLPRFPEFFVTQNMLFDGEKWYGQYPPGYSMFLALGVLVGMPWLVSPIASAATGIFLSLALRETHGERVARMLVPLLLITPFFLFLGADFMNHSVALCGTSLAVYSFFRLQRGNGGFVFCLLFGLGLGTTFLTRPLCALAGGVVFALFALPDVIFGNRRVFFAASAVSTIAVSSLMFFYNRKTTGEYLLSGYTKLWGAAHGIGFHESPWGYEFTLKKAIGNQLFNLGLLNEYLFEWCLPGLSPIAVLLMLPRRLRREDRFYLTLALAFPAAYFFYWHRDSYLGPRFLYCSLAGFLPLTVVAIDASSGWLQGREVRLGMSLPALSLEKLFGFCLFFAVLSGVCLGFPSRALWNHFSYPSMRIDVREIAKQQGIAEGVIFVPISWGGRMLSILRTHGISAPEAERAYREVDHCALWELALLTDQISPHELQRQIHALVSLQEQVRFVNLNGDRSLRLAMSRTLTPRCVEEIEYDKKGFSIYLPHLTSNSSRIDRPFIVASDLRARNSRLLESHPGLPAFILRDGVLVPWRERGESNSFPGEDAKTEESRS